MVQFSHDAQAGTLYCYFTELEAGQAVGEAEADAHLLSDQAGSLVGVLLQFAPEDEPALLGTRVLQHPELVLDYDQAGTLHLLVALPDATDAQEPQPLQALLAGASSLHLEALEEPAIFDLDAEGAALGFEVFLPDAANTPAALTRLAPWMVALEDDVGADADTATAPPGALPPATDELPTVMLPHVGVVALVGKPNVGKSTLLNTLLGQKVAIVSHRPQTTRLPVRGILSRHDAQIVLLDTPGIHKPRHALGQFMVRLARQAIPAADLICFMGDISTPPTQLDRRIARELHHARVPCILVLNKVDVRVRGRTHLEAYRDLGAWDMEVAISASKGDGVPMLLEEIVARLPAGQQLYPTSQIADQSEQHLAAELVREKVLHFTEHEVPHAVAVVVEEWQEKEGATYIRMTINVERTSQKGIVIGAGGAMLKRIGSAARLDIEQMLGRPIYLDLWVKVQADWRNNPASLGWLGYRLKEW
jgi:GTP-binding protein Era